MNGTSRFLFTLFFGTLFINASCQLSTVHAYGQIDATEQAILPDCGRIVYGHPISMLPYHPARLTRLDSQDQVVWSRTLSVSNNIQHVATKADGSMMVQTCALDTSGLARPALTHLDSTGNLISAWYYAYGTAAVNWLHGARSADGMNLLMGSTMSYDPPYYTNVLAKINDGGAVQWARGIGPDGSNYQQPTVYAMSDGRSLISSPFSEILAVESNGNLAWASRYPAMNQICDAVTLGNGNYLLAGYTSYITTTRIALLELTSNGNVVSMKTYGHEGVLTVGNATPDRGVRFALASNGNILVRQPTASGNGGNGYLLLLDPSGTPIWGMGSQNAGHGTVAFLSDSIALSTSQFSGVAGILRRSASDLSFSGCMINTAPLQFDTTSSRENAQYELFPVSMTVVPWSPNITNNQMDAVSVCDPLVVEVRSTSRSYTVLPSYVLDQCRVLGLNGKERIEVVDMLGVVRSNFASPVDGVLDLRLLSPGYYLLRITGHGIARTLRIVKT